MILIPYRFLWNIWCGCLSCIQIFILTECLMSLHSMSVNYIGYDSIEMLSACLSFNCWLLPIQSRLSTPNFPLIVRSAGSKVLFLYTFNTLLKYPSQVYTDVMDQNLKKKFLMWISNYFKVLTRLILSMTCF